MCSIASGSSGNCIYAGSDTAHILIDDGISGKRTVEGLNLLGIKPEELDAIFVTHEHSDHIGGLGILSKRYGIPIYATPGTIKGMKEAKSTSCIDASLYNVIRADETVSIKDLVIHPMKVSHDANEPVAYRVYSEGKKLAVITDLGTYDDYTVGCLQGMDVVLCEANHDVKMLEVGPYPYQLKRRILGDRGHLSNDNSGRLISALLNDNIKHIYLGHLSKENNIPELAFETVRLEIEASQTPYHGNDFPITVARRDRPLDPIEF